MLMPCSGAELETVLASALDAAYDLLEFASDQGNRVAFVQPEDILVSTLPEVARSWLTEERPRKVLSQASSLIQAFNEAKRRLFGLLCQEQGAPLTIATAIGEEVTWPGFLSHTVAHWLAHLCWHITQLVGAGVGDGTWNPIADALRCDPTLCSLPCRQDVVVKIDRLAARWAMQEITQGDTRVPPELSSPASQTLKKRDLGAEAIAMLVKHQDWSVTRIAKELGCRRQTLYKFDQFRQLIETRKGNKRSLPRGTKIDGRVEAYYNDDEDE